MFHVCMYVVQVFCGLIDVECCSNYIYPKLSGRFISTSKFQD